MIRHPPRRRVRQTRLQSMTRATRSQSRARSVRQIPMTPRRAKQSWRRAQSRAQSQAQSQAQRPQRRRTSRQSRRQRRPRRSGVRLGVKPRILGVKLRTLGVKPRTLGAKPQLYQQRKSRVRKTRAARKHLTRGIGYRWSITSRTTSTQHTLIRVALASSGKTDGSGAVFCQAQIP